MKIIFFLLKFLYGEEAKKHIVFYYYRRWFPGVLKEQFKLNLFSWLLDYIVEKGGVIAEEYEKGKISFKIDSCKGDGTKYILLFDPIIAAIYMYDRFAKIYKKLEGKNLNPSKVGASIFFKNMFLNQQHARVSWEECELDINACFDKKYFIEYMVKATKIITNFDSVNYKTISITDNPIIEITYFDNFTPEARTRYLSDFYKFEAAKRYWG
jgi:hypothetical protein